MHRSYGAGAGSTWAMLAVIWKATRGAAEALRIRARGDADDTPEMAVQLALIVKADGLRGLGDEYAILQQLLGTGHAQMGQVLVRRPPHFGAKSAHQVKLV